MLSDFSFFFFWPVNIICALYICMLVHAFYISWQGDMGLVGIVGLPGLIGPKVITLKLL